MPKDAKLGLVVGVGLVVLIAVVFFKKDSAAAHPTANPAAAVNATEPPRSEPRKSVPVPASQVPSAEPPAPNPVPVSAPTLVPN